MSDILQRILVTKQQEVALAKSIAPFSVVEDQALSSILDEDQKPRGFYDAIEHKIAKGYPGVIAEIKQASPSRGILRDPFEPSACPVL